jgi:hypothetical protein
MTTTMGAKICSNIEYFWRLLEYDVTKDGMARGVIYPSKTDLKLAKRKQLGLIRAPAVPP